VLTANLQKQQKTEGQKSHELNCLNNHLKQIKESQPLAAQKDVMFYDKTSLSVRETINQLNRMTHSSYENNI
jgi:cytidylate kinase